MQLGLTLMYVKLPYLISVKRTKSERLEVEWNKKVNATTVHTRQTHFEKNKADPRKESEECPLTQSPRGDRA